MNLQAENIPKATPIRPLKSKGLIKPLQNQTQVELSRRPFLLSNCLLEQTGGSKRDGEKSANWDEEKRRWTCRASDFGEVFGGRVGANACWSPHWLLKHPSSLCGNVLAFIPRPGEESDGRWVLYSEIFFWELLLIIVDFGGFPETKLSQQMSPRRNADDSFDIDDL